MSLAELARVPWHKVTSEHMDALRSAFGGRCKRCNGRWSLTRKPGGLRHRPLEFAHVRPTGLHGRGRGLQRRFFDILRHPDAYTLLCKKCHGLFDCERLTAEFNAATAAAREAAA